MDGVEIVHDMSFWQFIYAFEYELTFTLLISALTGALTLLTLYLRSKYINWVNKRKYNLGDFSDEIMVNVIVIDEEPDGIYMRPRAIRAEDSLEHVIKNSQLITEIREELERRAKWTEIQLKDPLSSFFVLPDARSQEILMKRMVHIVSEITGAYQLERAVRGDHNVDVARCWATLTLEPIGTTKARMLRIQVIADEALKRFAYPEFIQQLLYTPGEGPHVDGAETLHYLAIAQFGLNGSHERKHVEERSPTADQIVRFVAVSFPKLLDLSEHVRKFLANLSPAEIKRIEKELRTETEDEVAEADQTS